MVQGRMVRVVFTYQNPVLKLIDRISLLCRREGYCLDATFHHSQRRHPWRIFWDSRAARRFILAVQLRPTKLLHLTGDKIATPFLTFLAAQEFLCTPSR